MERETNEEYTITESLTIGKTRFVLGEREVEVPSGMDDPAKFVTWRCNTGSKDYFWGHYLKDRNNAVKDLCQRAIEYIESL